MQSTTKPVWSTQLNPGELVEPYPEFQESEDQEQADQDKVHSETCVERVECSLQLESGENGTLKQI